MGRGRGKSKKSTVTSHEDPGSGEEERIPAQKRRGRPQKPLKDDVTNDEESGKTEADTSENKESSSVVTTIENGKKRKRNSPTKEKQSLAKEESGIAETLVADVSTKPNGFRHIGSRRKNKPRRAAEVGVEC